MRPGQHTLLVASRLSLAGRHRNAGGRLRDGDAGTDDAGAVGVGEPLRRHGDGDAGAHRRAPVPRRPPGSRRVEDILAEYDPDLDAYTGSFVLRAAGALDADAGRSALAEGRLTASLALATRAASLRSRSRSLESWPGWRGDETTCRWPPPPPNPRRGSLGRRGTP